MKPETGAHKLNSSSSGLPVIKLSIQIYHKLCVCISKSDNERTFSSSTKQCFHFFKGNKNLSRGNEQSIVCKPRKYM